MTRKIVSLLCIVSLTMFFGCDGGCGTGETIDMDADGFSSSQGDCDDNNPAVNPSASETCNGIDDNCNGQIDAGCYWNNTFGGYARDIAYSVIPGNNGGYVIAGSTFDNGTGGQDVSVIKIGENRNEQWHKTFGGNEAGDIAWSVTQGNNDGYVVAGLTHSYDAGNEDAWIIKIDENGNAPAIP